MLNEVTRLIRGNVKKGIMPKVKFWLESNLYFDYVTEKNFEEVKKLLAQNETDLLSARAVIDFDESRPNFGFRIEHTGTLTLKDWLELRQLRKAFDGPTTIQIVPEEKKADILKQLDSLIRDYYVDKGYVVGSGDWEFAVNIQTRYKLKSLNVYFYVKNNSKLEIGISRETTQEMFKEAFEFFTCKEKL